MPGPARLEELPAQFLPDLLSSHGALDGPTFYAKVFSHVFWTQESLTPSESTQMSCAVCLDVARPSWGAVSLKGRGFTNIDLPGALVNLTFCTLSQTFMSISLS